MVLVIDHVHNQGWQWALLLMTSFMVERFQGDSTACFALTAVPKTEQELILSGNCIRHVRQPQLPQLSENEQCSRPWLVDD